MTDGQDVVGDRIHQTVCRNEIRSAVLRTVRGIPTIERGSAVDVVGTNVGQVLVARGVVVSAIEAGIDAARDCLRWQGNGRQIVSKRLWSPASKGRGRHRRAHLLA